MPFLLDFDMFLNSNLFKTIAITYKMSEFISKNKFLIHVSVEVLVLCMIVLYISRNNSGIYNHMRYLEQKLYIIEQTLENHQQILSGMGQQVPSPPPAPRAIPQPPQPPQPTLQPDPTPLLPPTVVPQKVETMEIIETPSVDNDNMDIEIEEELRGLNLIKD
jgi:hypothetical protein